MNDPDYDTSFAVWLIRNHERISGLKSEPLINRLAYAVDMLDATAGSFPLDPESRLYGEVAWIFQPYTEARLSGHLTSMNAGEMETVIDAICSRINDYVLGKGERRQLDTRYERIAEGDGWTMIREIGADARTKLFVDGIFAFVAVRIRQSDGAHIYSIGRISPLSIFLWTFSTKSLIRRRVSGTRKPTDGAEETLLEVRLVTEAAGCFRRNWYQLSMKPSARIGAGREIEKKGGFRASPFIIRNCEIF